MAQSLLKFICTSFIQLNNAAIPGDVPLRQEMHAYIAGTIKAYGSHPLIVGGTADHVHILCTLPKTETYAKIIGESKRNSSKWIKTKIRNYPIFIGKMDMEHFP